MTHSSHLSSTHTLLDMHRFTSDPSASGTRMPYHLSRNLPGPQSDDSDSTESRRDSNPEDRNRSSSKPAYACMNCKRLKVKCEFMPGPRTCRRCQARRQECLPRDRKKRPPAPSQEELQRKSNAQSREIESLLLKLDLQKRDAIIRDMLSRWECGGVYQSLHPKSAGAAAEQAVCSHFSQVIHEPVLYSGPKPTPPDIVKFCGLFPDEILDLFNIFFEKVNVFFSILDPELHRPERLIWTSPFLFTVICAIASRYYTKTPRLHPLALEFAEDAARKALNGPKNVDVCQAFLLLAVYPKPKKKWAEDNSWLLMGVAIRLAIELGLNQPPSTKTNEREKLTEREELNRTRTWLNCFCVDISHAVQFGKMPILRVDDYLARTSREWYRSSPLNQAIDVHLCGYVEMLIIMTKFRAQVSHCQGSEIALAIEYEQNLANVTSFWVGRYMEHPCHDDRICSYRSHTSQMISAYLRLVVLALGFQRAAETNALTRDCPLVQKSITNAQSVIQRMLQSLFPTGNLRYAMQAHFLFVSYAAAFLVNLLRPSLLHLLGEDREFEIIALVQDLIGVLGSEIVALDERHSPAIYSRFLTSLLAKYHSTEAKAAHPIDCSYSGYSAQPMSPSWPDIYPSQIDMAGDGPFDPTQCSAFHHQGEPAMNLSLLHFMQAVTDQNTEPQFYPYDGDAISWDRSFAYIPQPQIPDGWPQ